MSVTYIGYRTPTAELLTEQLVECPPPVISIDLETISREDHTPIGFSIAVSPEEAWYFQVMPEQDEELDIILPLLNNSNITKVFHNAPFDIRLFPLICSMDTTNIADTNVMARILGYQDTKLSELTRQLFQREIDTVDTILPPRTRFVDMPSDKVAAMCCSHAQATLQLYNSFVNKIQPKYLAVEHKAIPILVDMSDRGLKIDQAARAMLESKLEIDVAYYKSICEAEDFNPGSPMQAGYILAKRGNFLPFTRSKKQYRTDNETLEFLDDPLASAVLSYRKVSKLLSTYIKPLANYDRLYTMYNLDAVVGRISSGGANNSTDVIIYRNLQNIPPPDKTRELLPEGTRFIFLPDSGVFTTGDFSQEHLRILAHLSQDREMLRVYQDGECEGDIHLKSALELFGNASYRKLAKTINYAIPYGADAHTISIQARIRDERKCATFLDNWFRTYRDAAEWIKGAKEEGLNSGWSLPTLFGRRIRIPDEYNARTGKLDTVAMGRKAVNYPILGSDGEIMKRALIICEDKGLPLAVTVHDSITCDGSIEFPIEQLEHISEVHIPFEVKKSVRWE